jgi:hypothetical protein
MAIRSDDVPESRLTSPTASRLPSLKSRAAARTSFPGARTSTQKIDIEVDGHRWADGREQPHTWRMPASAIAQNRSTRPQPFGRYSAGVAGW